MSMLPNIIPTGNLRQGRHFALRSLYSNELRTPSHYKLPVNNIQEVLKRVFLLSEKEKNIIDKLNLQKKHTKFKNYSPT